MLAERSVSWVVVPQRELVDLAHAVAGRKPADLRLPTGVDGVQRAGYNP
jgi:hypothetical protein